MNAEVILKSTGAVTEVSGDVVDLTAPSIVRLDLARADVATMERQGSDLVMRLANGEQMRVADFYPEGDAAVPHDLVLRENDGTLWHARTVTLGAAGGSRSGVVPPVPGAGWPGVVPPVFPPVPPVLPPASSLPPPPAAAAAAPAAAAPPSNAAGSASDDPPPPAACAARRSSRSCNAA